MQSILTDIYTAILPTLLELIAAILGVVLLRVSAVAKEKWGIEIEARHREAFQTAVMSGIAAALAKGLQGSDAIDFAVKHVEASVPDALAALKPSAQVLTNIASAKLNAAATSAVPSALIDAVAAG